MCCMSIAAAAIALRVLHVLHEYCRCCMCCMSIAAAAIALRVLHVLHEYCRCCYCTEGAA